MLKSALYYFTAHPNFGKACDDSLDRIDRREISGVPAPIYLPTLLIRLMTIEAADALGWPMTGMGHRLKQSPAEKLGRYRQALEDSAITSAS
jgi:hypothetical protein